MNPTIIIINHSAITVWRDGRLIDTSPEIATLSGSEISVSHEVTVDKINSSQAVYRYYWCELSEEPLSYAIPNFRHNGDLAYKHLEGILARIGMPKQVIISVPSYYTDSQLSLLLGICNSLQLQVCSFVDSNVAGLASEAADGEYLVVDIKKDETNVSEIMVTHKVTRKVISTIPNVGTEKIYSVCSGIITEKFLDQTRYDPLHAITSEYSLLKDLPSWLKYIYTRKEQDGVKRSALIPTAEIIEALKAVLLPIKRALPRDKTILIAPSIFEFIKGGDVFPDHQTVTLQNSQNGIMNNLDIFTRDVKECPFILDLPSAQNQSNSYSIKSNIFGIDPSSATHILSKSHAQTLSGTPIYLLPDGEFKLQSQGPYVTICIERNHAILKSKGIKASVNGMTVVDMCKLKIGDRIALDDGKECFIAIHVTDQNVSK
jgi:hypothetical protein